MRKKIRVLSTVCILAMMINLTGCGSKDNTAAVDNSGTSINEESSGVDNENAAVTETDEAEDKDTAAAKEKEKEEKVIPEAEKSNDNIVVTDLKPSEGLEFESNGDGTCTIISAGVCTDKDIVIPDSSPNGDTVTLIDEYAFYSLEDVESVTLVNYNYEIDKYAFQYGEFTTLNIVGGSPIFKQSAFSSCEDLTSISFSDCNIQADEYAFYGCGKDAELVFSNCTGFIDDYAFQYGEFVSLAMDNCELEISKSAFSSCEDLTSIVFNDCTIQADEYAFFGCGDSANVEMINCAVTLDDRVFQYSSFDKLTITGSKVEMGDSAFSNCEDLSVISIDCESVSLGEYAFFGCEDLMSISICENTGSDNNIEIGDYAFQYCERLESAVIGDGTIEIGEYVFMGCADNLTVSIAGSAYNAGWIQEGLSQ